MSAPFLRYARAVALAATALGVLAFVAPVFAQDPAETDPEMVENETIQVTATRVPEPLEPLAASITVVSGDELRARGATHLADALALVAGVSVAPGGDGGPATAIPELWGLKEADAYLLVVDGVPRGGAFNPDTAALDLNGVERIEVLRGSAPVVYGATSFVGVIHVIHQAPGAAGNTVRLSGGNLSSGSASVRVALPGNQSLTAGIESRGAKDDRTQYDRGQALYRTEKSVAGGTLRLDLEAAAVRQDPASPHPRQGRVLSTRVPLDANHNPTDARIDEDRYQATVGFERSLGKAQWSTTLSLARSELDIVRGFLLDLSNTPDNARGFRQDRSVTDLYFDTHGVWEPSADLRLIAGVDHLYGKGEAESELFDYTTALDGRGSERSSQGTLDERVDLEDERNFTGLYGQAEWHPAPRWRVELGVRLNRTDEDREAEAEPAAGGEEPGVDEAFRSSREVSRGSGILGVSFLAWGDDKDDLYLYGNYRNTFKPAAIDFGPEAEGGILKPEVAKSFELGARGHLVHGAVDWELSAFRMNFDNLVLSQIVNGSPALQNAGQERFEGIELELGWRICDNLRWQLSGARHDAKFRDFLQEFDGVPTQLRGNRLELSPRELASTGLVYAPPSGFLVQAAVQYVGDRYLNKRNTALAAAYTVWGAGVGYRFRDWEIRLDGRNLGDERPAISESELGDAQYYRLPARTFELALSRRF